jgi:hypothetical protein
MLEQIEFVNSDKSIVFKAESFDVPPVPDKNSFNTFGIIGVDGSGLSNIKSDRPEVRAFFAYSEFSIFVDDYVDYTGKIMIMNNATKSTNIYNLKTKKESSIVFGSDNGGYFASAVIESGAVHVRVYSTDTGELVHDKTISADSAHLTVDPVVKILDNSKTLIVLLGNRQKDIGTKVVVDNF